MEFLEGEKEWKWRKRRERLFYQCVLSAKKTYSLVLFVMSLFLVLFFLCISPKLWLSTTQSCIFCLLCLCGEWNFSHLFSFCCSFRFFFMFLSTYIYSLDSFCLSMLSLLWSSSSFSFILFLICHLFLFIFLCPPPSPTPYLLLIFLIRPLTFFFLYLLQPLKSSFPTSFSGAFRTV